MNLFQTADQLQKNKNHGQMKRERNRPLVPSHTTPRLEFILMKDPVLFLRRRFRYNEAEEEHEDQIN